MKRIVVIALAVLMLAVSVFSFAACAKTMKCESCTREEKCKEVETVDGSKKWLCSDCQAINDAAMEALESLGDLVG